MTKSLARRAEESNIPTETLDAWWGLGLWGLYARYFEDRVGSGHMAQSTTGTQARQVVAAFIRCCGSDGVTVETFEAFTGDDRYKLTQIRPFIRWLAANGHIPENFVGDGRANRPAKKGRKTRTKAGTLAPHVAEFLRQTRAQGKTTKETSRSRAYTLRSLDESFGDRPLDKFGVRAVERWMEQNPHWKPSTRRTHYSTAKVFTRWMQQRKLIVSDPFADLEPPKVPRPVPRPIDRASIDDLLAAAPDARGRLIVLLMFSMGLRCVGVSNLRVEDVDHVSKVFIVKEKFGNERRLPITPQVAHAMETYLRERPARTGPLVRSNMPRHEHDGLTPQYISQLVGRWMRAAGVKHYAWDGRGAHALRHTALTELAEATGDAFLVQELAGWSNPGTAQHYVRRASTERLREALAKRDEAGTCASTPKTT